MLQNLYITLAEVIIAMKILLVEDELDLAQSVSSYLKEEGYICETATSFNMAEAKLSSFEYDVILLDITLPGGSGLSLIQLIKEVQPADSRILIISARNSLDDKLEGLNLGADDYLTKPFHIAELNSRINAIIRRKLFDGKNEIRFNEILFDLNARRLTIAEKPIELTRKEYDLLLYFVTNKNRVLTKEGIAEHLWGDHIDMANNFDFVYTHIKNLRRKVEQAGGKDYLKTVYGMGYRFTDQ